MRQPEFEIGNYDDGQIRLTLDEPLSASAYAVVQRKVGQAPVQSMKILNLGNRDHEDFDEPNLLATKAFFARLTSLRTFHIHKSIPLLFIVDLITACPSTIQHLATRDWGFVKPFMEDERH